MHFTIFASLRFLPPFRFRFFVSRPFHFKFFVSLQSTCNARSGQPLYQCLEVLYKKINLLLLTPLCSWCFHHCQCPFCSWRPCYGLRPCCFLVFSCGRVPAVVDIPTLPWYFHRCWRLFCCLGPCYGGHPCCYQRSLGPAVVDITSVPGVPSDVGVPSVTSLCFMHSCCCVAFSCFLLLLTSVLFLVFPPVFVSHLLLTYLL
jgi:hypothetical protein